MQPDTTNKQTNKTLGGRHNKEKRNLSAYCRRIKTAKQSSDATVGSRVEAGRGYRSDR
jgi:hypothetical protein